MSFLDDLRALRAAPQAVWLQFIGAYRVACFDLYLFFEGQDDFSYYQPHLRHRWAGRGVLQGFNCEGKDAVIAIMPRVKSKLDYEWRALFFVDKDLDDYCGSACPPDKFLYQTEWYSIENYIATVETLSVIWADLLRLPMSDDRLVQVTAAYHAAHNSFCNAMRSVMAWVIHLRRLGHRVVLNDVSMDNIISLDSGCICTLSPGWADHILAASNTHGASHDPTTYASVESELSGSDPKTFIRGKFEMWFFVQFVLRVVNTVTERVSGQPRTVCRVQITQKTAIDLLAPRVITPSSLAAFLSRTLPG